MLLFRRDNIGGRGWSNIRQIDMLGWNNGWEIMITLGNRDGARNVRR